MASNFILQTLIIHTFLLTTFTQTSSTGSCFFNGLSYQNNAHWQLDCQNCSCQNSIPICHEITCKYTPCTDGKVFILNQNECCPTCELPKASCHYKEYIIEHNTEFSPKLCETCKCKNGQMECVNSCSVKSDSLYIGTTSLSQREDRLKLHNKRNRKHSKHSETVSARTPCLHEGNVYAFNATWSPLRCTQCKCHLNSEVDCYVKECPEISNCQHVRLLNY